MKQPRLGAHVSVKGGLVHAFENAEAIGAQSIQIFGATPRGWSAPLPTETVVKEFKTRWKTSRVREIYLHAGYLPNIASPNAEARSKSVDNLAAHLAIAHTIGAQGLIIHLGSGKELPKEEAITHAIAGIKEILRRVPGDTLILLENMAGGGERLGATLHELGILLRTIKSLRIGICFDTAHALEAGIIAEYTPRSVKEFFDMFEREIGTKHIRVLHVNDSKTPYNSHHDRHENLGKGYIGLAGFQALATEKRIHNTAWILEVPGFDDNGPDKKNMEILRNLFIKT